MALEEKLIGKLGDHDGYHDYHLGNTNQMF